MSTRLTKKGVPMVESQSLKLVFAAAKTNDDIAQYLAQTLSDKGYQSVTPSVLSFLSTLECGVNYASEIARNLDISRQMVAKTVKELCRVGYLEQAEGPGKQKQILFTDLGEQLMADSRQSLAQLDRVLSKKLGIDSLHSTLHNLQAIQTVISQANNE